MKTSSISIIFLITICGLSALVNSQTDSCSSVLNLSSQGVPFDTTSLDCLAAWNSYNFILRYIQTSSNLWSFVLSTPASNSYVAIGFSTNGLMVGSSAIVGWTSSNGSTIKQYYLGGQTPSQVVAGQGNLLVNSSSIVSQSSRLYLAFQLNTNQPQSQLLYAIGPTGVLPVAPTYALSEHSDQVSTAVNYATGQSSSQTPYGNLRLIHGVLSTLGWSILMIIGTMVARYFKEWGPIWFYSHTVIQSCAFILGVAGIVCGFVLNNKLKTDNISTHKGLGIFVLVLGCLQVMAFLARPDKSSKVRKYWNWYHYGVGRIVMVFAIATVFTGIHLSDQQESKSWNAGYGVFLAILFLVAVVLEFRMRMRS